MVVSRHLVFYQKANSAIRSADPENPGLEPNMEWIGCTVCEIFAFKLYCDFESGVRGHSRSSKVALFDRAHTTLYSSSKYASIYYRFRESRILIENRYPLYSASPLGMKPSDYATTLGDEKREWWAYQIRKNFDDTFSRFDTKHACYRQTDRRTELQWHLYALQHTEHTAANKKEREREFEKQNAEEI